MKTGLVRRMVKDAQTPLSKCLCFWSFSVKALKSFLLLLVLGSLIKPEISFGQSANLDQIRNGALGVYAPTPAADWVNGNAGPSNAHFSEGYSIPYRMSVASLVGNANTVHHLIIEWDTKHSNGHAIDYITHYQNLDNPSGSHLTTFGHGPEVINPTLGTAFAGAPSLFPIPAPSSAGSEVAGQPTASFNALPGTSGNADIHKMAIWGGTIVSLTYVFEDAQDATTGQTETRLDIAFRSTNGSTALLAWAGHIAAEYDWGAGRGATGVSGSPYHTRLISIDGSGGNQDRSLKATAVIIPPPLCAISSAQLACPETPFLEFNSAGSSSGAGITYLWTLTNGNPSAGAKIDPVTGATGATVKVVPVGSAFIAGGTFSLTLKVTKSTGQNTTCSRSPAGTIVKVVVGATATPTSLDLAVSNTSQLNTVLTGSDDTNPANYTYSWTQAPPVGGSLSASNIRNPVFTATDPGSYTFTVTATQVAAPNCSNTAQVTVNVGASAPPCTVSGPSPICPSTTRTYVYDPTGDGVADPLPANFTAQWSLENNTNGATSTLGTTNSTTVTASAQCATAFRIRITLTSTSGLISSTCFKDVTVNDVTPPTITSCPADVVLECDASTDPSNTGTATASDNCSASVDYQDQSTPGCYRKIVRTWTATDPCGNTATCVQTIILRDRTAPTIDCSGGGTPTVSDNCSATIDLYYRDNGSVRTWTATDESGNVASCTQNLPAPPVLSKESAPAQQTQTSVSKTLVTNQVTKPDVVKAKDIEVKAYPNPFGTEINFRFVSPKSGKAVLEIYDLMGRRLGIAYQGNLEANEMKTIVYKVPSSVYSPVVYKLSVNDLSARGKLMPAQK